MKKFFPLIFIMFLAVSPYAQSPVTLVQFYDNYMYDAYVQNSKEYGHLEGKSAHYLMDVNIGIEYKAAVINALIKSENKNNASAFAQHLARKYGKTKDNLDYNQLTGVELFSLGYLKIVDQDGNPDEGLQLLERAKNIMPNSYTVSMIYSLAMAQDYLNKGEKCIAWQTINSVFADNSLSPDMSAGTTDIIFSSVEYLKSECN